MLPETLAWTLLERHCRPLREAQWVGHDFYHRANWADPAPDHVDLVVDPKIGGDTAVHPRDCGAALRLALAVVRAVSCCRGFDTVTHPRFWRRAVESLWRESFQSGHGIPPPENASALSSTAFTHIALRWHAYDPEDNAFWLGFFHGTRACDVALSSVLESLGVVIALPFGRDPQFPDLRLPLAILHRIPTDCPSRSGANDPACGNPRREEAPVLECFGVVLEYRVDDDPSVTRDTLDLLTRAQSLKRSPRFFIDRLSIQLAPPYGPRRSGPHPRHRKALVRRGRVLGPLLRLAWLAFALHCRPHRRVPLALSLQGTDTLVHPQASEYIQRLVARGTPLRDVVGDMLRLRFGGDDDQVAQLSVTCLRLGSSVRLMRGARLFAEPIRDTDEFMFVALEADEEGVEVDAVAHVADCGGWVGVVYAGYGLVWTPTSNVIAWHRLDEDDDVVMSDAEDEAPAMALSSLALGFEAITHLPPLWRDPVVHRVPSILPLLPGSATLRPLIVDRAVVTRYDLETLLASFPHLQTLQLDRCVVETLAPLVDAYRSTSRPCRITVLSLHGVRDLTQRDLVLRYSPELDQNLKPDPTAANNDHTAAWLLPLVDALTLGILRGLQELGVDVIGVRDSDAWPVVTRLVSVLTNPSSGHALTRLHVACHRRLMPACGELLEPLRDAVLHDPPCVRRAVLSVLHARGCGGAHEIVRNVLAMAEGSLLRAVTWAWK